MATKSDALRNAREAKKDEFYTQYHDIEVEMNSYLEYDPNVFRGKTVLLPCDDPESSNFTRFFAAKFEELGLKKLISTSYAPDSKKYKTTYIPSLFELEAPQFDNTKTTIKGKIFVLERDNSRDGRINIDDLEWKYLEGDGDFRSNEVSVLRNEADIIITNPPFSLFREFLAWIMEANKKFIIIGTFFFFMPSSLFSIFGKSISESFVCFLSCTLPPQASIISSASTAPGSFVLAILFADVV